MFTSVHDLVSDDIYLRLKEFSLLSNTFNQRTYWQVFSNHF